ncbi:MAG: hypothetical protein ACLF0G_06090 [Candidatus Brocadiia bacterium]
MRRLLPLVVLIACAGSLASAGEAPEPEKRLRLRLWRAPFYVVLGLPRDVLDAPVKGASAIPIFNRVFIAPLYLTNIFSSYTCWSFTEEGIAGGFNAWFHVMRIPRKRGAHTPEAMVDRPWSKDFFPNWRTFRVISWEPVAKPKEKEEESEGGAQ